MHSCIEHTPRYHEMTRGFILTRLHLCLCLALLLLWRSLFVVSAAGAPPGQPIWTQPEVLFPVGPDPAANTWPVLRNDPGGGLHLLWTSIAGESDGNAYMYYSHFDGQGWSEPNDVMLMGRQIPGFDAAIDHNWLLHTAWCSGGVHYSSVDLAEASDAKHWTRPIAIDADACETVSIITDSSGRVYIFYVRIQDPFGLYMCGLRFRCPMAIRR
ncbi:MAG: hypothetical protein M1305_05710 [Candidatus Marsarchaeota archaeon]|nr:hypothetical protein [Candidatus Marsarchaeota archaeon]